MSSSSSSSLLVNRTRRKVSIFPRWLSSRATSNSSESGTKRPLKPTYRRTNPNPRKISRSTRSTRINETVSPSEYLAILWNRWKTLSVSVNRLFFLKEMWREWTRAFVPQERRLRCVAVAAGLQHRSFVLLLSWTWVRFDDALRWSAQPWGTKSDEIYSERWW